MKAIVSLALIPSLFGLAHADVLRVGPAQLHTTIQSAVDAAAAEDLILVEPGSYAEFAVDGKDLSIVGDGGIFTVLESTSPEPAILVENLAAGQEVTIVGAQVRHAVSFDTPAVIVRNNAGSVRFSGLDVRLDSNLALTSATAAVRIESTDTFWLIDSDVWTSTAKAAQRSSQQGTLYEAVSGVEVEDSDGIVQNGKLRGYDALSLWGGDGLRVIGESSVWIVDDLVASPTSTILRGGTGFNGGSALHYLGPKSNQRKMTICGSVKLQAGVGTSQSGGKYALNGDFGLSSSGGFEVLRLPNGCRNYEYAETSVDSPTASIGSQIQIRLWSPASQPYVTLVSPGSMYQRRVLNLNNRAMADPAAPYALIVGAGFLTESVKKTYTIAVPNEPALIGIQLTIQSGVGLLGSQQDALSFPSLVVIVP